MRIREIDTRKKKRREETQEDLSATNKEIRKSERENSWKNKKFGGRTG